MCKFDLSKSYALNTFGDFKICCVCASVFFFVRSFCFSRSLLPNPSRAVATTAATGGGGGGVCRYFDVDVCTRNIENRINVIRIEIE